MHGSDRVDGRIAPCADADAVLRAMTAPIANVARDGRIAVYEEFLAAQRTATTAAWDLFVARHPRSELATAAMAERDRLAAVVAR